MTAEIETREEAIERLDREVCVGASAIYYRNEEMVLDAIDEHLA